MKDPGKLIRAGAAFFFAFTILGITEAVMASDIVHDLGLGSRNADVAFLQSRLQDLGFFSKDTKSTGYFGLITKKAVIAFQAVRGISPTGFVGPLTRSALNDVFVSEAACLPKNIMMNDIVEAKSNGYKTGRSLVNATTVAQTLFSIHAHCNVGQLYDMSNTPLYFYHLIGCWGNPPMDYRDRLLKQQQEIADLSSGYHVIQMTCNPSGVPIE